MPLYGPTPDATTSSKGSVQLAGHLAGTAAAPTIAWTYNPFSFRAYDSGGTTLTDNAFVQINLATEDYDYNSNFTASAYTAPVAGVYNFSGCVTHATVSVTPVLAISAIFVDAVQKMNGTAAIASAATNTSAFAVAGDLLLAAGAVVTLRHFQNSNGNEASATNTYDTWFSGHLVHRTA